MLPQLGPHEVVLLVNKDVGVKLVARDGSTISAAGCMLRLTNQHIDLTTPTKDGVTYRVVGKGDREFHDLRIPVLRAAPHRLIQPWFGPYKWEALLAGSVVSQLEPQHETWTLTLTFGAGGVFEYRQSFLKAYADASQAASEGIDEVLPAYEA